MKLNDIVKEAKKPKVNITPVQPSQSHVTPPPPHSLSHLSADWLPLTNRLKTVCLMLCHDVLRTAYRI